MKTLFAYLVITAGVVVVFVQSGTDAIPVLVVGVLLLCPIGSIVSTVKRFVFKGVEIEFEKIRQQLLDEIGGVPGRMVPLNIEPVTAFEIYESVRTDIRRILNTKVKNDRQPVHIELRFMCIGMVRSFVLLTEDLVSFVAAHPNVHFKIEILLTSPEAMGSYKMAQGDVDWVAQCSSIGPKLDRFVAEERARSRPRFDVQYRYYDHIPHWHGILIDREELYLGRSSWSHGPAGPQLLVGQNKYRYYSCCVKESRERVDLFAGWFEYYWVCHSTPSRDKVELATCVPFKRMA